MHNDYTSATILSTVTNFIMNHDKPFTHTYRTYIRLRESGPQTLHFWHSNAVDSTWDMGQIAAASDLGGKWRIEAAFVADGGMEPKGDVVKGSQVPLTFDGNISKIVQSGEKFWSDEVQIDIPAGHFLAFTWSITTMSSGKTIPFNTETLLATVYDAPGILADQESSNSYQESENQLVVPTFIGYKKQVEKQLIFLGDSITQGVRTAKDQYEYWVARIAAELPTTTGVWNIGSGWARAYDAATDGAWLYKAKQADEIVIVLGVNDLGTANRIATQLMTDLTTIISTLKINNPLINIILCTVPTFNFTDEQEKAWRKVNDQIRTKPPIGVDRVFDIAEVLSQDAPNDHQLKPEYMTNMYDPHPNGIAGKAIAEAFLAWY
ncbi:GDSL family lipase [Paenibacillus crassostreae]|uniref:GDSL family lipase n=2 Tax=Paenibacillus crassostreae TaxID=1763538 RepID=A0A162KW59_9BACL|nr:GDSL family lipase [Paenibacillus crassostreae]OAB74933.1 GDSL family lipase [Paenibacillus crassostreae]